MPSDLPRIPVNVPTAAPEARGSWRAVLLFGLLPMLGLLAELWWGLLSIMLPMFPHVGWAIAAGAAVMLNALLWLGGDRWAPLPVQALLHGFVLSMALFYGFVEAPAVPSMIALSVMALGLLAAAPYWVLFGMGRLLPELARRWRAGGYTTSSLLTVLVVSALLPFAVAYVTHRGELSTGRSLRELEEVMRDPSRKQPPRHEREVELAAALRAGDIELQRNYCLHGTNQPDPKQGFWGQQSIGDGRAFWFVRRWWGDVMSREVAQRAFYRAHGFAAAEASWRQWDFSSNGLGGAALLWQQSELDVDVDTAAAIARVDWQLEVHCREPRNGEARFELRLPFGAVATGLSLWIAGEERPAAFAGAARVQAAYDKVVASRRDPALLQDIGAGRLRLLLFPVSSRLPPMRVRLGFTVPLRYTADRAELSLPLIDAHNCRAVPMHKLVVHVGDDIARRNVGDLGLRQGIVVPIRPGAVCARDADGWVTQELVPRSALAPAVDVGKFVVVVEASATVASQLADAALLADALPEGASCTVLFARGAACVEVRGVAGDEAFAAELRAVPFEGGCDARRALGRAFELAQAQGVGCVHWLRGAMATPLFDGPTPEPPNGLQLASLAVGRGSHWLFSGPAYAGSVRDIVPTSFEPSHPLHALADEIRWLGVDLAGGMPSGDRLRRFTRSDVQPVDVPVVDDRLARLWASVTAQALARGGAGHDATKLAARYRLVAAGTGAVVLENVDQYRDARLDPGARIGREPESPIGTQPVPEPSSLLLLGTGLLAVLVVARRRSRAPAVA